MKKKNRKKTKKSNTPFCLIAKDGTMYTYLSKPQINGKLLKLRFLENWAQRAKIVDKISELHLQYLQLKKELDESIDLSEKLSREIEQDMSMIRVKYEKLSSNINNIKRKEKIKPFRVIGSKKVVNEDGSKTKYKVLLKTINNEKD